MRYIEKNISQFIESQFPDLYKEEGPILIEFIRSYFEWMESEGNTLYKTRRLLEYRDIDTTLDEYLEHFRNKYAQNLDLNTAVDKKLLIKNIQDLYKSKGSERSYEILFRSIYNKDIRFYYPGDDILRVSDGEWYEGKYVEITSYVNNIQDFVGKEIRGYKSGASALVENFSQRVINNKIVDVLEISHVKGFFAHGERIYPSNSIDQPIAQIILPKTTGSLTAIGVIDGGSNFDIGNILDITGKGGKGKAKVTSTFTQQGRVNFTLENGGTGYSMNAVTQVFPQMQLTANTITGNINPNQLLFQTNGSNTMIANGIVMAVNSSVVTIKVHTPGFEKNATVRSAQKIILDPTSGTFSNGEFIYQSNGTSNIATGTIVSIIPGVSNTAYYVANITGNFVQSVYNISGNTFVVRGNTSGANGFLFETVGGPGTGSFAVANLVGGGTGATFRVGAIFDKEIISINSDIVRDYINTRLMLINESSPLTGTVAVTTGQSNVTGTSTLFTSQVTVGGYIQVANGAAKEIRQVNSIVNNTLLTITDTFSNTQSGVNLYVDQINYMFPKVSSVTDVENLSTILENSLTYSELEVGTIQYLAGINPGSGYSLDPYASVVEPLVAALEIDSPTGIKGADAIVNADAGTSNGIVMGVTVINSGFGYEEGERLELSQTNSAFAVVGSAIVSSHGKQEGYWKSTKGFLDSDKYIQDSYYYQQFSYEIQAPLNFDSYKDVVKELLHTAGTEFFGKFYLNDIDLDADVTTDSIISNTEIALPNNYPTVRPNFYFNSEENDIIPAQAIFTRSSSASYFDANGVMQIVGPDVPRFAYDQLTLQREGLLIEENRTNYAKNPWCAGSNTTNAPTGWSITGNGSGMTREFVGSGIEDGIPYVDIRWWGVPTGGLARDLFFCSTTETPAADSDTFISSFYVKMIAGSTNNIALSRFIIGRDNVGGGFLDPVTSSFISLMGSPTSNLKNHRVALSKTFSNTSIAFMQGGMRWVTSANLPFDITLRIGAPQIEKAPNMSSNIFPDINTPNSQSTRNGDRLVISNPTWGGVGKGTVSMKFKYSYNDSSSSIPKALWTMAANADFNNAVYASIDQNTLNLSYIGRDNSVLQWNIQTPIVANTVYKIAHTWQTNDIAAYMNSVSVGTDTSGTVNTAFNTFKIGSNYNQTDSRNLNGYIKSFAFYDNRLSNNELIALSTL